MNKPAFAFLTLALCLIASPVMARPTNALSAAEMRSHPRFVATVDNSGSMRPMLKGGDRVVVTVTTFDAVAVGDVVVYWPKWKGCPVIHLVVKKTDAGFICRGVDNRFDDPEPMTAETFVGIAAIPTKPALVVSHYDRLLAGCSCSKCK